MKQVVITCYGSPDVLAVRDAADPEAGPGEVRIRVAAAGLNFSDLMARQGLHPDAEKPPMVMGYEVAGIVDRVGSDVATVSCGDRVLALTAFKGQSELVVTTPDRVFPLPEDWSYAEGAALPVVYLTAHHMLVRVAAGLPGEVVLVHAAAGGVGLAVAELGKILKLRVIGLAGASKHGVLREYDVEPVDSADPHWCDAVRRLAPRGVDIVLDGIGGPSFRRGYDLLAPGGRLVMYGASSVIRGPERSKLRTVWQLLRLPRFGPLALMNDNRTVAGVSLGRLTRERLLDSFPTLMQYARSGRIRPRVGCTFRFSQAADAHRYVHERRNVGKVILVPD